MLTIGQYVLSYPVCHLRTCGQCFTGCCKACNDKTSKGVPSLPFAQNKDLRYEDIPEPKCGQGQIKIKPAWCGICGSDLHEYLGGPSICPTSPHPITGEQVPVTFGHEFSGVVEELGKGVSEKWKVGDRVCVQPIIYDGDCGACQDGLINCCYKNGFVGLSGKMRRAAMLPTRQN